MASADGMKTGFTCPAGFNLVATASENNRRLMAVVLGATSGRSRADWAQGLLVSGFASAPSGARLGQIANTICRRLRHHRHVERGLRPGTQRRR